MLSCWQHIQNKQWKVINQIYEYLIMDLIDGNNFIGLETNLTSFMSSDKYGNWVNKFELWYKHK